MSVEVDTATFVRRITTLNTAFKVRDSRTVAAVCASKRRGGGSVPRFGMQGRLVGVALSRRGASRGCRRALAHLRVGAMLPGATGARELTQRCVLAACLGVATTEPASLLRRW